DESIFVVKLHSVRIESNEANLSPGSDYRIKVGPRDGGDARKKCSKEASSDELEYEEIIAFQLEPDETLSISFGRSNDFFELGTAEVEDPFRQPQNLLISLPLLAPSWSLMGGDDSILGNSLAHKGNSNVPNQSQSEEMSTRLIGYIDLEFFHFYDV